jgi:hypothetical protein
MCECGCSMGNPAYRLPINSRACFLIELYPGCKDCVAPPGIIIRKIDSAASAWEEVKECPLFPLSKIDDYTEGCIACGPDSDEFRKAALPSMVGTKVEGGKIDEILADILAEDIWEACLRKMPRVISYEESSAKKS